MRNHWVVRKAAKWLLVGFYSSRKWGCKWVVITTITMINILQVLVIIIILYYGLLWTHLTGFYATTFYHMNKSEAFYFFDHKMFFSRILLVLLREITEWFYYTYCYNYINGFSEKLLYFKYLHMSMWPGLRKMYILSFLIPKISKSTLSSWFLDFEIT